MVMTYVLGSPVLDHVYNILIIEYECLARPGYFEFDYSQEERNKRVEDALLPLFGLKQLWVDISAAKFLFAKEGFQPFYLGWQLPQKIHPSLPVQMYSLIQIN